MYDDFCGCGGRNVCENNTNVILFISTSTWRLEMNNSESALQSGCADPEWAHLLAREGLTSNSHHTVQTVITRNQVGKLFISVVVIQRK